MNRAGPNKVLSMIVVNEDSPRWLRELSRFLPLKSLLFVHGNILDLVSFPVVHEGAEVFWTEDDLLNFFQRFLKGAGYRVVGYVDAVDGLSFPDKEMEGVFKDLSKGKAVEAPKDRGTPGVSYSAAPVDRGYVPGGPPAQAPPPPPPPAPARARPADFNQIIQDIRQVVSNPEVPCAFVFNLASRLVTSPGHVSREERVLLTKVLKASLESADVILQDGTHFKNVLILVCDKINDLPPFLFVNNPRARSITIDKPDTTDRSRFLARTYPAFHGAAGGEPSKDLTARFAALTEGLTNYELMSLVQLSRREAIDIKNVENIIHRYKYGVKESEWDKLDRSRLAGAEEHLKSRVKGQDNAVSRVVDIVKRAKVGLAAGSAHASSRPRGVLFFAGPTGVGKTEMAKGLAELLFGQEDRCIRFDMSEYSAQHSDEKLLGAPPGYVGYEEGGQLTNALKEKPFSILLFDEIEKAHGGIFDKFLQILDDGRITDGKGETVYFSETIIIFTSNLGTVGRSETGERQALVDPSMPYEKMRDSILEAIRDHFNFALGRPEILNRFGDNFIVFDFIRPPVDELIVDLLIKKLAQSAAERWDLSLTIEPEARATIIGLARGALHHGGRGIRNVVDSALVNPLTRFLFDQGEVTSRDLAGAKVTINELKDMGEAASHRFEVRAEIHR